MSTLRINGVDLAFDEAGEGPAVLLLHAGIADRRMWRDVMPAFTAHFRTIAPDLRAYGDTPLPEDPFCWTSDVLGLMDGLGIERAHLVGVSMSGQIAIDLALAHPERVDRLVLVGTGIPGWEHSQQMSDNDAAERRAIEAGDYDQAAWTEVRVWLDGPDRSPDQVDPELRQRVFEMQRHAYEVDNDVAELRWLVAEPREHYPRSRPRPWSWPARSISRTSARSLLSWQGRSPVPPIASCRASPICRRWRIRRGSRTSSPSSCSEASPNRAGRAAAGRKRSRPAGPGRLVRGRRRHESRSARGPRGDTRLRRSDS